MPREDARETAEAVARRSYGKLIAYLAARTHDVAAAEDALSDAFAAALSDWRAHGIPDRPEAWLVAVARRRLIDAARRRRSGEAAAPHLQLIADELQELEAAAAAVAVPDDRLALMFACAHPAIEPAIRAPLILQTILGFDAATIASAFLVSPATMGQRLVRAKTKIRQAGIPFRVPEHAELRQRLDAVLAAIYAAFAEGWSDPAGTETRRRNLAEEGIWLGRLVTSLMPEEPEALGLLALMLHAEARRSARRSAAGDYVPLADQDPASWDGRLIEEAEALLTRAGHMGTVGRYQLEAAVQSAHAARRLTGATDWAAIERMYEALLAITDSPVVAINRAIAVAESRGAAAGLASLDTLAQDARLAEYQPYWAARAGLLARTARRPRPRRLMTGRSGLRRTRPCGAFSRGAARNCAARGGPAARREIGYCAGLIADYVGPIPPARCGPLPFPRRLFRPASMPTVSIFYGIVIQMFHRDHGPPHVHAKYHGSEAQVRISDGDIHRGFLPPTARRLVKRWVFRYKMELELNWRRGQQLEPFERIPGLYDDQDSLD